MRLNDLYDDDEAVLCNSEVAGPPLGVANQCRGYLNTISHSAAPGPAPPPAQLVTQIRGKITRGITRK